MWQCIVCFDSSPPPLPLPISIGAVLHYLVCDIKRLIKRDAETSCFWHTSTVDKSVAECTSAVKLINKHWAFCRSQAPHGDDLPEPAQMISWKIMEIYTHLCTIKSNGLNGAKWWLNLKLYQTLLPSVGSGTSSVKGFQNPDRIRYWQDTLATQSVNTTIKYHTR